MYRGINSPGRTRIATGQEKYGLKNKVHSVQMSGMGTMVSAADYYGPPLPGQSFSQFESFMKLPLVPAGLGLVIGLINPVAGAVVGIGSWLLSGSADHSSKPTQQGG